MFEVTLEQLRAARACYDGYNKVVRMVQGLEFTWADNDRQSYLPFGYNKPIGLSKICDHNGLDDAVWATQCVVGHDRDIRLYAVWCARQVQHLTFDPRSINAILMAERVANGLTSRMDLYAFEAAAGCAAWMVAQAYENAACAVVWTGSLASYKARIAAVCAARVGLLISVAFEVIATVSESRLAAAWSACPAGGNGDGDGDGGEAWDRAYNVALSAQTEMFLKMCNGQAPWQLEE